MKSRPMEHQVAIVTGASSGIGLGITRALLEQGYRVVANSQTKVRPHCEHFDRFGRPAAGRRAHLNAGPHQVHPSSVPPRLGDGIRGRRDSGQHDLAWRGGYAAACQRRPRAPEKAPPHSATGLWSAKPAGWRANHRRNHFRNRSATRQPPNSINVNPGKE